jgi:hypothetical protein
MHKNIWMLFCLCSGLGSTVPLLFVHACSPDLNLHAFLSWEHCMWQHTFDTCHFQASVMVSAHCAMTLVITTSNNCCSYLVNAEIRGHHLLCLCYLWTVFSINCIKDPWSCLKPHSMLLTIGHIDNWHILHLSQRIPLSITCICLYLGDQGMRKTQG